MLGEVWIGREGGRVEGEERGRKREVGRKGEREREIEGERRENFFLFKLYLEI